MRSLILISLLFEFFVMTGCNKKDSTSETNVKVKKEEITETHKPEISGTNGNEDNKSSGETSALKNISSKEVKFHIGDSLNVKGFIADVFLSDKVAYLNFENKFPKNEFACAIFSGKFNEFGNLSKFKNKNVEVTGKISTYKNKPQIILESGNQIKILP